VSDDELIEGIDYYWENGFMVFTAIYLRKRGFCCRSGCRHCPYGYVRESESRSRPSLITLGPRSSELVFSS
jgi:hypothetical protein